MTSTPAVFLRAARRDDRWLILRRVLRESLDPTSLQWQRFVLAEDARGQVVGFAQLKDLGQGVREFGSLVVEESVRRQGIGGALIRHFQWTAPLPLYLLCALPRVRYYRKFGYRRLTDPAQMPDPLRKKWQLGMFFARLVGQQVAVMRFDG